MWNFVQNMDSVILCTDWNKTAACTCISIGVQLCVCRGTISLTHRLIADGTSKVPDDETLWVEQIAVIVELGFSRHGESEVPLVLVVDGLRKASVGGLGKLTLLIQEVNDTTSTELHQICVCVCERERERERGGGERGRRERIILEMHVSIPPALTFWNGMTSTYYIKIEANLSWECIAMMVVETCLFTYCSH